MNYEAKNYDHLLGTEGFSDQLLKNHFTLYQGYVTNTNKIAGLLEQFLKEGKETTPEYAELKRRFGWEFNGMRFHQYYFGNMKKGGVALNSNSDLANKIATDFGSIEMWQKDFKATGTMRGIGWVVLEYHPCANRLFNVWINEHDGGHLAGTTPILVMDVFEHAFMIDYGLKRADYIVSFLKAIDLSKAEKRFDLVKASQPSCAR
ncbi:MAG: superoxide dismutase [Omnitrophica bacterium RIFCSPLOWO2_12_FULL_44_17]|uniref:superoxide dismutase n=1 Tax=Candidatus Danuiimicrobium aquiferis TaxID=1801832 RepID=A0A1G1L2U4_9BACT|nr:MAG: superoxide dismutase [Omnitrophica bacterium RIFCSPHIGHO2_02_FULL_45_28]OGW89663.1 MAG: superoxide dismutase [Omnitrophica bacterium RIFCSPHIGHO2_12_FULL_44_12]OGW99473.1 MAG: superoxide dismutase [Omnitrophica bacterium RIFCSPLOWO2_12_FULL_44_17]OGX04309.1 MAG: superoxide dismutase [Omnitrophica bacterium RIFCSPLOWO2_02_FULL_44_11]